MKALDSLRGAMGDTSGNDVGLRRSRREQRLVMVIGGVGFLFVAAIGYGMFWRDDSVSQEKENEFRMASSRIQQSTIRRANYESQPQRAIERIEPRPQPQPQKVEQPQNDNQLAELRIELLRQQLEADLAARTSSITAYSDSSAASGLQNNAQGGGQQVASLNGGAGGLTINGQPAQAAGYSGSGDYANLYQLNGQQSVDSAGYRQINIETGITTPRMIRAGTIVRARLMQGINSDSQGMMRAMIEEDVYDSITGSHKLIPRGSLIVGSYASNVLYGDNRLRVIWNRLQLPNGKTIDWGGNAGGDLAGNAGFRDQVNNHYGKLFGQILMLSLFDAIGAGVESELRPGYRTQVVTEEQVIGTNPDGTPIKTTVSRQVVVPEGSADRIVIDQFGRTAGGTVAEIGSEVIRRNLAVRPTLSIRPGYAFTVQLASDLNFDREL